MSKQRKFRVKALSVAGMSNRIFHLNNIVNEDAFEEGHADILVKDGFLEECKEDTETIKLTEDNLNENPDLGLQGLKVGDEIQIPKQKGTEKKATSK